MKLVCAFAPVLSLLVSVSVSADIRAVVDNGFWNDPTTWAVDCLSPGGETVPGPTDDVVLCPGKLVTLECAPVPYTARSITDSQVEVGPSGLSGGGVDWKKTDTGGLQTQTGCASGEVPTLTLYADRANSACGKPGAASGCSQRFTHMGPGATYKLIGSSITTDAAWGEPLDLVENCGGDIAASAKTGGIDWEAAKEECSVYTWARAPYRANKPVGFTNLKRGDLVWFTTGLWRNNWAIVIDGPGDGASTPMTEDEVRIAFTDPDDGFGTTADGTLVDPSLNAMGHNSLAEPINVRIEAWDATNPARIKALLTPGALQALTGAQNGNGQRAGSCLITRQDIAAPDFGSGKFYRIAASFDGGTGQDELVLDPWEEVAAADTMAGFLAASPNAWIGPCVKPGDRWYAFEPVVVTAATPGTNYNTFLAVNGLCPTFDKAWFSFSSPAGGAVPPQIQHDGYTPTEARDHIYAPMLKASMSFFGQRSCTMDGPLAIGPSHGNADNPSGYGTSSGNTIGLTFRNWSYQGQYFVQDPSYQLHAFVQWDSLDIVYDRINVSFINDNALYNQNFTEEGGFDGPTSDNPDNEGVTLTLMNSNFHDLFDTATNVDGGSALSFTQNQASGPFTIDVHDNLVYNVDLTNFRISSSGGTIDTSGVVHSNVVAASHRYQESDVTTRANFYCPATDGGSNPLISFVNNVLLTDVDYIETDATRTTIGFHQCDSVLYNYIGEHAIGILKSGSFDDTGATFYGNLFEMAGAVSATNTSSQQRGIELFRPSVIPGGAAYIIKQNTMRRFCSLPAGQPIQGVRFGSGPSPTGQLLLDISQNSFGMWCQSASDNGLSPLVNSAALFVNGNALDDLHEDSLIGQNLFVTGDYYTSMGGTTGYRILPMRLANGLTEAAVVNRLDVQANLCTECSSTIAGTCSAYGTGDQAAACCRQCSTLNNGYRFTGDNIDLEQLDPPLPMEAAGIRSGEDLRLVPDGSGLAWIEGTEHLGAGYSGILSYRQAMIDADLPQAFLSQAATDGDAPDESLIPASLAFLLDAAVCGNGTVEGSEQCDDGNGASSDGCSSTCMVEPGWACSGIPSTCVSSCNDGIDNDGDGLIDHPADPGCRHAAFGREDPECDDGVDNDGDGGKDLLDPQCYSASDRSEGFDCSDGIDNDGDGLTDTADPGCLNATWPYEDPECSNGFDDDGDGMIDWSGGGIGVPDPQCTAPYGFKEKARTGGCGLGAELALVLAALLWVGRRPVAMV